ncbi:hypothetical protein EVAR_54875_1 [Eumeta japonica]|uniref:Uncharacterized protein n=1 Tax=Eumeta variegata TaxID=151549 RepID=A0A4C1YES2_EUMVA|nr:hypothetical protein EVAR_54875_1 [Eumeta japonica]
MAIMALLSGCLMAAVGVPSGPEAFASANERSPWPSSPGTRSNPRERWHRGRQELICKPHCIMHGVPLVYDAMRLESVALLVEGLPVLTGLFHCFYPGGAPECPHRLPQLSDSDHSLKFECSLTFNFNPSLDFNFGLDGIFDSDSHSPFKFDSRIGLCLVKGSKTLKKSLDLRARANTKTSSERNRRRSTEAMSDAGRSFVPPFTPVPGSHTNWVVHVMLLRHVHLKPDKCIKRASHAGFASFNLYKAGFAR